MNKRQARELEAANALALKQYEKIKRLKARIRSLELKYAELQGKQKPMVEYEIDAT